MTLPNLKDVERGWENTISIHTRDGILKDVRRIVLEHTRKMDIDAIEAHIKYKNATNEKERILFMAVEQRALGARDGFLYLIGASLEDIPK